MSMTRRTETRSRVLHGADGQDPIRVQGVMPALSRPEIDVLDGLKAASTRIRARTISCWTE